MDVVPTGGCRGSRNIVLLILLVTSGCIDGSFPGLKCRRNAVKLCQ